MKRKNVFWILFAIVALTIIVFANSNPNSALVPYYGKWSGGFNVEAFRLGQGNQKLRDRASLRGYLMLYATGKKFKLHLEGEQEIIDLDGTWTVEKERVMLRTTATKIDDMGGEEARDPNKFFVTGEAVRDAYARPIPLRMSKDRQKLTGLRITIGEYEGTHEFTRG